jgi:hypothetical protein
MYAASEFGGLLKSTDGGEWDRLDAPSTRDRDVDPQYQQGLYDFDVAGRE